VRGVTGARGLRGATGPIGPVGPVVSHNSIQITPITANGTCVHYSDASVALTAPVSGKAIVHFQVWFKIDHASGTLDQVAVVAGTSATDCSGYPNYASVFGEPAALPTAEYDVSASGTQIVNVSAGTTTFYINGEMLSGASSGDKFWFGSIWAELIPS
jgi:hypothetical protein